MTTGKNLAVNNVGTEQRVVIFGSIVTGEPYEIMVNLVRARKFRMKDTVSCVKIEGRSSLLIDKIIEP